MKKFLTIAAAVATSAVLITSVFAETTNDLTATYDASTGIVTLGNAPTLATTTYIVFDRNNQDGFATEAVAEGQIKQINQEENAVTQIYVGSLADGKYQVRLGGDGNVRNGLFEVASATPTPTPTVEPTATPEPEATATPTPRPVVIGNADMDAKGRIQLADATTVAKHVTKVITLTGDAKIAANADGDAKGRIQLADAAEIAKYVTNKANYKGLVGTKKYIPWNE